jgi:hypothetical protein
VNILSSNNIVGGASAAEAKTIAFNDATGVVVFREESTGDHILPNCRPKRHYPSAATTPSRFFTFALDISGCHVYYVAITGLDNGREGREQKTRWGGSGI